jgi:hypothetical protein
MPLGCIKVDDAAFPPVPRECLRCGREAPMRFAGPCAECLGQLRETVRGEARMIEGGAYEPKMHVTPNAVALKDD